MTFGRIIIAIWIGAVILLNVGCARDDREVVAETPTLTIHLPDQDERSLGPLGTDPWFLVLLGLAIGPENSDTPEPRLLDRWEHTPDFREWTVHVRKGVVWDDGVPVTAEDVKFSLDLWTAPEIAYEHRFYEEISVIDSQNLRIVFPEPVTNKIFVFNWLVMLPKHLLESHDLGRFFSWPYWVQPVGNGPYRYVRHIPGAMTELEANPAFYGLAPGIEKVVLRYGGSGLIELVSGNADIASQLTSVQAAQLGADPRFRLYHRVEYHSHVAIVWNHRNPLFGDAEVRRALTMAIDRPEMNRILNFPEDLPIFDVPINERHHLQGVVPDPLPFAPDRSAQILDGAGWVDTDNDGIREKDGQDFQFTLSITEKTVGEAVFVQEQLHRIGIGIEISTYERDSLRHRLQTTHEFDATIENLNHIESFGEFLISGYENAEVSRIRDFVWYSIDLEAIDEQMLELWKIFEKEVPITYLHPRLGYLGAHERVRGLQNDVNLFQAVEHLSIEE